MPIYLLNIINITKGASVDVVNGNIVGYMTFLLFGFILNFRWVYTSLSIVVCTAIMLLYYSLYVGFRDIQAFSVVISFVLLIVYACYFYEKNLKESFLHIDYIKTMNSELKEMFDKLPEGVILFN